MLINFYKSIKKPCIVKKKLIEKTKKKLKHKTHEMGSSGGDHIQVIKKNTQVKLFLNGPRSPFVRPRWDNKDLFSPCILSNDDRVLLSSPGSTDNNSKGSNLSPFSDQSMHQPQLLVEDLPSFANNSILDDPNKLFGLSKNLTVGNKIKRVRKRRLRRESNFHTRSTNKKKYRKKELIDEVGFLTNLASISKYSKKNQIDKHMLRTMAGKPQLSPLKVLCHGLDSSCQVGQDIFNKNYT
ncbi:unnamed protein product [Moneuplotes crassus]|uniref:Uncharacterized protein n=1 Tax=Euplotes crassus TaxID=5936 RepID=A0AAD1U9V6_EUPCR|nr:unnamed protein product [Moneuplotes crassus]